jgi:cytochrome c oxidase subunit III
MAESSMVHHESGTSIEGENNKHLSLETQSLGMWLFLVSEILFFGNAFTAYIIYRYSYPSVFQEASNHLDLLLGSINTAVLLTSSLCMALAVNAAARGSRKQIVFFLLSTIFLGVIFLGIKSVEYSREFAEHLFPGGDFTYTGLNPERAKIFFSLYFTLTGLHAVHMIIGILMIAGLAYFAWQGRFTPQRYAPVEMIGLYWHFVDIVWIFIFPLMYLVGPK